MVNLIENSYHTNKILEYKSYQRVIYLFTKRLNKILYMCIKNNKQMN